MSRPRLFPHNTGVEQEDIEMHGELQDLTYVYLRMNY